MQQFSECLTAPTAGTGGTLKRLEETMEFPNKPSMNAYTVWKADFGH